LAQIDIAFRLFIFMTKETMEKLSKYLLYTHVFFLKSYLNRINITIKKKKKNLIQGEANKFLSVSKCHINVLQCLKE